jgi:hypothetical protein
MQTTLLYSWESITMQDVGPGDADVCTKSGRHTSVKINLTRPILESNAKRLKMHVVYDVIEGRSDYTHLQMSMDIFVPLPVDWTNIKVPESANFLASFVVYGKNHRWNQVNISPAINWLQTIEAKIDGPGDDAEGNAGLRINFAIPLEYTKTP